MVAFLTTVIYQPLLNLTIFLYGTVGIYNLGFTIILMTFGVRVAMLPLSMKMARSQREMAAIAPELEQIKQKHKGDITKQSEETMKLYRERGISPLAGCLPMLIQFPLLIGLYRVFINLFKPDAFALLYSFVPNPGVVNHIFLGFIDVSKSSPPLVVIAAVLQFLQARMALGSSKGQSQMAAMNQQMVYLLPVIILVVGWNLSTALVLYWIATTTFSIGEQLYLRRR